MKVNKLQLINFFQKYPTPASIILAAIFLMIGLVVNGVSQSPPSVKSRYLDCLEIAAKNFTPVENRPARKQAKEYCFDAFDREMWRN